MKRTQRAVLATAAASILAAGAGAAIASAHPTMPISAVPVAQPMPDASDSQALRTSIDQLTAQTTALQAELAAANKRLAAMQAARRAAASPPASRKTSTPRSAAPARRSAAPAKRSAAPAKPRRSAPTVHARTGASSAGHEEHEEHESRNGGEHDDD